MSYSKQFYKGKKTSAKKQLVEELLYTKHQISLVGVLEILYYEEEMSIPEIQAWLMKEIKVRIGVTTLYGWANFYIGPLRDASEAVPLARRK